ncbi:MAG: hypothetical protein R3D51_17810 [Hyphomicrobiaceae bacterium]
MGHSGDGNPEYIAERTAVAAVAGGTASVLSGGKFANGAITGAFAQLYNGECQACKGITGPEMGGGSRIGAMQGGGGAVGIGLGAWMSMKLSSAWDAFSSWAMAPADVGSGDAGDPRVTIYRAIDSTELSYLEANGNYGHNPSMSGKYFGLSLSGVQNFAGWSQNSGATVTSTTVPQSVIDQGYPFSDPGKQGAGASVFFSDHQLDTVVYPAMTPPINLGPQR